LIAWVYEQTEPLETSPFLRACSSERSTVKGNAVLSLPAPSRGRTFLEREVPSGARDGVGIVLWSPRHCVLPAARESMDSSDRGEAKSQL